MKNNSGDVIGVVLDWAWGIKMYNQSLRYACDTFKLENAKCRIQYFGIVISDLKWRESPNRVPSY